jgi:sulfur relay (sulfurtransferase) DsrF/TusC family protein
MKSLLFIVSKPPYKSENPKLAITHAMSCYVADIHTDEEVEPILAFVELGVLNCVKDQKEVYGITTTEQHIRNQLASDMKILVCKEDLEKFGITEDRLIDARDLGAEVDLVITGFSEILKEMEECDQLIWI